jgi:hypothetical protein
MAGYRVVYMYIYILYIYYAPGCISYKKYTQANQRAKPDRQVAGPHP